MKNFVDTLREDARNVVTDALASAYLRAERPKLLAALEGKLKDAQGKLADAQAKLSEAIAREHDLWVKAQELEADLRYLAAAIVRGDPVEWPVHDKLQIDVNKARDAWAAASGAPDMWRGLLAQAQAEAESLQGQIEALRSLEPTAQDKAVLKALSM